MDFPLPIPAELRAAVPEGSGVLLGVSGGVDSSVALALLQHMGCEVVAVTFKNFCTSDGAFGGDDASSCCSLEAIDAARRQADRMGVKHWVGNVEHPFREHVIDPFVSEYRAGRTPNPCVGCNTWVRFPELARRADQLGLDFVGTGHYARMERDGEDVHLKRGVDRGKDQSYFLHGVDPAILARSVFPLGWWNKDEVRHIAAELGLESARTPDSQEICFVPDDDRSFLFEDAPSQPGDVVDRAGNVLGRHRGLEHYTVGQRKGLGIAAEAPLYVLSLDVGSNTVVLGRRHELQVDTVRCDKWRWTSPDASAAGPRRCDEGRCTAQLRHQHPGVEVSEWRLHDDVVELDLAVDAEGVAPGQSLVLYRDDVVVGGGRIVATGRRSEGGNS
jgi:tRNA-uridine 2-sulfurtransferase